jgi:hypothetical protein
MKFQRVLTNKDMFMKLEMTLGMRERDMQPYQLQLASIGLSVFTLMSVSTAAIHAAEHEVNPQILDYFSAFYFGLTTLTTVGFGDILLVTSQVRLVVCVTILAGVAIVPTQAASLVEAYLDFQKERLVGREEGQMLRPTPPTLLPLSFVAVGVVVGGGGGGAAVSAVLQFTTLMPCSACHAEQGFRNDACRGGHLGCASNRSLDGTKRRQQHEPLH